MPQSLTSPHSTDKPQSSSRSYFIAFFVIISIAFAGFYWWMQIRFIETTNNAYVEADISNISVQVPGYITETNIKDNQHVEKGQLLAQLEDNQYEAKVRQDQAALDSVRAELTTLAAKVDLQQMLISQAKAGVAATGSDLLRAKQQLRRETQLKVKNYSSQDSVDQMRAGFNSAKARLDEAQANFEAKQRELVVYQAQKVEATAKAQQAKAVLALSTIQLSDTQIRAPFSGIIGKRGALSGQYVQPGQALYSLVPDGAVWITANFKETQIQHMKPGQSVQINLDAFPDKVFTGVIDSLSPASGAKFSLLPAENATGNFTKIVQRIPVKIRLSLDEIDSRIVPGLSAVVNVDTSTPVLKEPVIAKVMNE
ncbi:HlyD family secretion protein [Shewanella surugensis]|uniref:HlyD family secretion protein n=1 Tax=Shewanella surugensis TaxID=212020 RepID=A0ABT0LED2_9GAMM|nr:HlyD family secretion protein [Shewanella surugensis]MCL1126061.1 HlyD family secretion protein [Shewanella surugensis]